MGKKKAGFIALMFVLALSFVMIYGCGKKDKGSGGSCSVNCSDPYHGMNIKQYTFISEDKCRSEGEQAGCKATYCPPTGNEADCYKVYP